MNVVDLFKDRVFRPRKKRQLSQAATFPSLNPSDPVQAKFHCLKSSAILQFVETPCHRHPSWEQK